MKMFKITCIHLKKYSQGLKWHMVGSKGLTVATVLRAITDCSYCIKNNHSTVKEPGLPAGFLREIQASDSHGWDLGGVRKWVDSKGVPKRRQEGFANEEKVHRREGERELRKRTAHQHC